MTYAADADAPQKYTYSTKTANYPTLTHTCPLHRTHPFCNFAGMKLRKKIMDKGERLSPHHTDFIHIDTRRCNGCGRCTEVCRKGVVGMVRILWHKHAVIRNAGCCTGCMTCVKSCRRNAISAKSNNKQDINQNKDL